MSLTFKCVFTKNGDFNDTTYSYCKNYNSTKEFEQIKYHMKLLGIAALVRQYYFNLCLYFLRNLGIHNDDQS